MSQFHRGSFVLLVHGEKSQYFAIERKPEFNILDFVFPKIHEAPPFSSLKRGTDVFLDGLGSQS